MRFNLNYDKIIKEDIFNSVENIFRNKIYESILNLKIKGAVTKEPVDYKERLSLEYEDFRIGEKWGDLFDCGWFNLTSKIENYNPDESYFIKLDFSGEILLYNLEGKPEKGFTNINSDFDRNLGEPAKAFYNISHLIKGEGLIDLWIETGANDLFGKLKDDGKILEASVGFINEEYLNTYYDLEVLLDLLINIDRDFEDHEWFLDKMIDINVLIKYQEADWFNRLKEIVKEIYSKNSKSLLELTAIGHAHIDLAWLWSIRETRRKIIRTLTNVFYLIERFDDFVFGISQPQMIEWVREDSPYTFKKLKEYVKKGRIVPQGGMWVEADTNVSGEEALVRQMLYGIRYFEEEFDTRVSELWLPDVFGYNGNLPQIIKKSGLDYFMTIKITWSLINVFPYRSFKWKGVDGSEVLVHMPPEGTYNSSALPRGNRKAEKEYPELGKTNKGLLVYGIGDGGGGPGREHVERIIRQKDLFGTPKIKFGDQNEFFKELEKDIKKLPSWKGELYLENHQGTYTSAPEVKRYNRLLEEKLRSLEIYLSLTNKYDEYKEQLETIWKEVLLYQFHDILPGSSIIRVYEECIPRYQALEARLNKIESGSLSFNPNLETVEVLGKDKNNTYYSEVILPLSTNSEKIIYEKKIKTNKTKFDTKNLSIKIDTSNGQIVSIVRTSDNRELLKDRGNVLSLYKDFGDGWNIIDDYRKQEPINPKLEKQTIVDLDRFIEITNQYLILNSKIKEVVLIDRKTDLIYFNHKANIQDLNIMLRTAFNFDIDPKKAYFDIQYGELERSAQNETSIAKAQFEVPGQKWVSYYEKDFLYGLVNKSKYGFYAKDGTLDINLFRTTNSPGKGLGIGKTEYSYVLCLSDSLKNRDLDRIANQYNSDYIKVDTPISNKLEFLFEQKDFEISTLKKAEDENGYILRIYNRTNSDKKLILDFKNYQIYETNLVEENKTKILDENICFGSCEVKTFLLVKREVK